jgi:hypothetical protein
VIHRSLLPTAVAMAVLGAGLTGCQSSSERSDVQGVAIRFVTAVEDKQGDKACALLTPDAEESVSGATDVSCPKAILNVDERGLDVRSVQVWGDAAQVKVGSDTVFLRRLETGWQVRAAGCQSQPKAAYKCDVEG